MGYSTQGFQEGTWVPAFTGFSSDPTGVTAFYILIGKLCYFQLGMSTGTSNATTFTVTLPFAANAQNRQRMTINSFNNNGAASSVVGMARTTQSSNVLECYTNPALAAWTGSNGKSVNMTGTYMIE